MSNYILSTDNRFYAALEPAYSDVALITAANRFPAVKLTAKQVLERSERRDKTGGRTFSGLPFGMRKQTSYKVKTYMNGWDFSEAPGYGPLFEAGMGQTALAFGGGTAAGMDTPTRLRTAGPHGLIAGQAVTFGGEIRVVTAVVDAQSVELNAPFTIAPTSGSPIGATITYALGSEPLSVSLFDYWGGGGVSRIVSGAAVDKLGIKVNADFHEFEFSGPACDILDDASFSAGQGSLTEFPVEPTMAGFNSTVIPGHLGQVWLGSIAEKFFTLTDADVTLDNDMETRAREFGVMGPRGIIPGRRNVSLSFSIYEQDDAATKGLYQAARQRSPISVFFQLGQEPGQLFAAYMTSVVPEIPEFDDSDRRVQWKFASCRAQGSIDDELVLAFG